MKTTLPLVLSAALLWMQPVTATPTNSAVQGPAPESSSVVVVEKSDTSPDKAPVMQAEFAYEAIVEIGAPVVVGKTPAGHRQYIPITGGRFHGDKLQGTVLPGGADWQTTRSNGVTEVDALYSMKCDDGTVIIVHNRGVINGDSGFYSRTATRFEVPEGPHAWLTRSQFVGTVSGGPQAGTVKIRIFRLR